MVRAALFLTTLVVLAILLVAAALGVPFNGLIVIPALILSAACVATGFFRPGERGTDDNR